MTGQRGSTTLSLRASDTRPSLELGVGPRNVNAVCHAAAKPVEDLFSRHGPLGLHVRQALEGIQGCRLARSAIGTPVTLDANSMFARTSVGL